MDDQQAPGIKYVSSSLSFPKGRVDSAGIVILFLPSIRRDEDVSQNARRTSLGYKLRGWKKVIPFKGHHFFINKYSSLIDLPRLLKSQKVFF